MSRTSDNQEKLSRLERCVRELLRDVLGMELNDEEQRSGPVGICLQCSSTKERLEPKRCPSCKREFRLVSGLFGVNNISQLIVGIEDLRSQDCTLDEFEDQFGVFLEVWEPYAESWGLQNARLQTTFCLDNKLEGVYGKLLTELESGLDQLQKALDLVENLDENDLGHLDEIEDHIRLFSRKVCSASAGIFTKLESQDGDFSSLLDAFGSF